MAQNRFQTRELRRAVLLLLIAVSGVLHTARAQVNFKKYNSLEKLFADAAKQKKGVFIDGYTDWCYWCKVLDSEVFSDKTIGDIINKNFIAAKFNMEDDSIGRVLARKYAVNGFPTAIVLSAKGNLVGLLSGYSKKDQYKIRIEYVVNKLTQDSIIHGFTNQFNLTYPELYSKTFTYPKNLRAFADSISVNQYLQKNRDWSQEVNFVVLKVYAYHIDDANLEYLVESYSVLKENFGKSLSENIAISTFDSKLKSAVNKGDEAMLNKNIKILSGLLKDGGWVESNYKITFYKKSKNYPQLVQYVESILAQNPALINEMKLNEIAWTLYKNCDDKVLLTKAIKWMEQYVIPNSTDYAYIDTYAALLYKTGNYSEAKTHAQRAIKAGKSKGEDVKSTEDLLKKIDEAQQIRH
jgi:thioredoxin-related protein